MKKLLLALLLSFLFSSAFASNSDSIKKEKVHIVPIPVLYYVPETRFAFGAGASFTFKLSYDSATNYSDVLGIGAYTQDNQIVLYAPIELYSKENKYYLEGELGFYKYSYYYWGIGTDRVNQELYEVVYPRIILNGYRKLFSNIYAGVDYYFRADNFINYASNGVLGTGEVTGSKNYTASGAGFGLLYDSRDSIFFPTKGVLVRVTSYDYSSFLGSTFNFQKVLTDVSWYKRITPSFILAMNQHNEFTFGNAPFDMIGLVGGSKQMRGYYYGYYRDKFLMLLQAEARVHIHGPWGFAIFGATSMIGHPGSFPDAPGLIFAEGAGLRYTANKKQHINIRGDLGYGNTVEYYLSVEEAF
ncbi:MAG TPA: BamA/TamA family outer membrane protein [Bacteroidia bacterium]|nr:BamA/TamA family outer membrane protein [Bacteroidia bacterium]